MAGVSAAPAFSPDRKQLAFVWDGNGDNCDCERIGERKLQQKRL
ncbi:MAG: PD40 domain-containing protein [Bryobacterales bacterium]|nr:PD40 domain-containing protein [Bryobacterales bacterium]MBV9399392.1 PD40 domain-containing protein [Bryobacterales bacterium]